MEMLINNPKSTVLKINDVDDLLYVKGSVPGPKNSYLTVRDAIKSKA